MRFELKEAIRRIYSDDYQKLSATEKQIGRKDRNGFLRRLPGWRDGAGMRSSRLVSVLLVAIVVASGIYIVVAGIYYFNRFSIIQVDLDKCESLVDNELKRRANLLPNLLIISAEYRKHEKRLYEHVSEMRTYFANLKSESPSDATLPLSKLMSSLLAIAEEYPDLKATQSFEKLMGDWTETEDRIAQARVSYIESIKQLNAYCTTFPSNLYAKLFRVPKREPFSFLAPGAEPISSIEFFSAYFPDDSAPGRLALDEAVIGQPMGMPRWERGGDTNSGLQAGAQANPADAAGEDTVLKPEDAE